MKLWYTEWEMREAKIEAQHIVQEIMKDIGQYIKGNVLIRMAWRNADRPMSAVPPDEWRVHGQGAVQTYYPEAELLVNGEVVRRDLLDLLYIDILHLELKLLQARRRKIANEV